MIFDLNCAKDSSVNSLKIVCFYTDAHDRLKGSENSVTKDSR